MENKGEIILYQTEDNKTKIQLLHLLQQFKTKVSVGLMEVALVPYQDPTSSENFTAKG